MFGLPEMQSTATSLFSAYASMAASMMLLRSMANEMIPSPVRSYIQSAIHYLFTPLSNQLTVVIDELSGMGRNQVYDAAEVYLRTKISPNTERIKVNKTPKQKNLNLSIEKGEEICDSYENIQLKWRFVLIERQERYVVDKKLYELSFNKKFKTKVLDEYLPYVLAKAKEINDEERVVKLYTRDCPNYDSDEGGSIPLDHPATFDTLLYGPPGTGKSSLIAAMANYLKFDVYDLELTTLFSNSELRRILVSTTNRSIIVIEDIDCSVEMHDRMAADPGDSVVDDIQM